MKIGRLKERNTFSTSSGLISVISLTFNIFFASSKEKVSDCFVNSEIVDDACAAATFSEHRKL